MPAAKQVVVAAALASLATLAAFTTLATSAWAEGFPRGHRDALGPRFEAAPQLRDGARHRPPRRGTDTLERLLRWNQIAIDASGLDHTPVQPGETRVFGEQLGPGRSSRAIAIVHIAMFDAVNAIAGGYRSFTGTAPRARRRLHGRGDRAGGARHAGGGVPVAGRELRSGLLAEDLHEIRTGGRSKAQGIEVGRRAAAAILAQRAKDGSQHAEPRIGVDFLPSDAPGKWRQDPVSQIPLAMGAHWGEVTPFVLRSGRQFRVPPPPAMTSPEYAAAFEEVKRLGGDGVATPTVRTEQQRLIGIYLGLRRHAEPVRAAAALQPDRGADRARSRHEGARDRAAPRARQRRDGRRGRRDLGVEVLLRLLAAGHRHPRSRPGKTAPPAGATATRRPSAIRISCRSARRRATSRARTSRRPSPPIRRDTRASAVRCSRSCASSTAPIASRSRSSRTS